MIAFFLEIFFHILNLNFFNFPYIINDFIQNILLLFDKARLLN
jgi:hypothetical protein